jgi:DHA1 family multidrug resistance protein-like MFS transporter
MMRHESGARGGQRAAAMPPAARRQLALVCSTDFLIWLASGAVYPYLPVFLREEAHASVTMLGVIAGAYFLAVFAFSAPAGWLSDRVGRKPMMILGTVLFAVSTLLFVTTTDPWWFIAFRVLEGIGAAAVVPAAQAFVAEITTDAHRSRAYGWLTTAQYGGLIAGPGLAWLLYALEGGRGVWAFRGVFLCAALVTLAAALLLAVFLREPSRACEPRGVPKRAPWQALLSRPVVAIIVVVATAQYAMGAFEVVWSIYLRDLDASMRTVGLTWVLFSAPLLLSFVGGRIADRSDRVLLTVVGFGVQAACWLLVPVAHDPMIFLVVLPVDGLAFALAFPAKQALLVQVSPRRWLGAIQGAEQTAMQLAAFAGTVTAPFLYTWIGGACFAVAGGVGLAGLAVASPTLYRERLRVRAAGSGRSPRRWPTNPTDAVGTLSAGRDAAE